MGAVVVRQTPEFYWAIAALLIALTVIGAVVLIGYERWAWVPW
jgi:hypothetical protein